MLFRSVVMFENTSQSGTSVAFRLEDALGVHDGVGASITVEAGGLTQVRELHSGGGFMAFDAPVAHFGLNGAQVLDRVAVDWPDGTRTVLEDGLEAGALYTIRRDAGEGAPS